jgi:hypothetical protein
VKNLDVVKGKDDLIYDLIFTEEKEFKIDVSDYVVDIYKYEEFILEIKSVLKKSKVRIVKSNVKLDSKTAICHLKVNK